MQGGDGTKVAPTAPITAPGPSLPVLPVLTAVPPTVDRTVKYPQIIPKFAETDGTR